MVPINNTIRVWREEREAEERKLLERFGLRDVVDEAKITRVLDEEEAQVRRILSCGLDIGGIAECLIAVSLQNHPKHGWVFVRCTRPRKGEMFRVSDHVS